MIRNEIFCIWDLGQEEALHLAMTRKEAGLDSYLVGRVQDPRPASDYMKMAYNSGVIFLEIAHKVKNDNDLIEQVSKNLSMREEALKHHLEWSKKKAKPQVDDEAAKKIQEEFKNFTPSTLKDRQDFLRDFYSNDSEGTT